MKRQKLLAVPDKTEISIPTEKINVHDLGANLSLEEKNIIKKAIEDSNNFLSGTKVEISDDGTATITFPDHTESEPSQETINRNDLIRELTPGEKQLLLEKQKEKALDEINQLEELTDDEKDVFKEDIGQATTIEEVEGLVAEAKAFVDERVTAEQSLEAEKQAAKTVIESLTLLSGPAKATLTEAVEQAQRSEEVESILELAQEKEDGLNHIAGLTTLTTDEKATYETDINNAETIEEIKEYVQNADEISSDKTADAKELAEAKEQASQEVDQYDQLTKEEKDVFKEDIGQATTIEEVEGLVAEAKAFVDERVTAEQSLEAEKQAAKTVIESLTLLSGPAKATLTEAVEQAQRSEEVESILELAQEKEDGLNHIAGLDHHTEEEKANLAALVNSAESLADFDQIDEDIAQAIEENDRRHKLHEVLVEAELGANSNNSLGEAKELTREDLVGSGDFSNPDGFEEENLGDYYVGSEDEADVTAEDFAGEFDKNDTHGKLVESELGATPNNSASSAAAEAELTREELSKSGEFSNPESGNGAGTTQPEKPEFEGGTHGLGLINEKPEFPAEELARLLQVERDKAAGYIVSLPNLDTSKVNEFKTAIQNAQTVPAIEEIIQAAEALNAKSAQTTPESGNGAGTTQPEKPEFEGGTHGLGLINEKPEFPAEELARLLQVERDKAADYIASLPNLDVSKVNEFKVAIQNAQTVPVIEEIIQTAEALNAKLVQTTPESGNGAGTIQPEKPEFEGGTHGLGLINEKPEFPAEELARLLQVERDKAAAYIANLLNLDTSKVNEFKAAIQNAQTVPVIEEIIQAIEALNTELGREKVGNEQGKPAESKGPAQSGQVELEKERPTDKPAVTDHLKNLKTEVNAQQTIQESTKQEKSGERLPDTATISWLLGVTGISTLLAGLGLKKKREDDDK